MHTPITSNLRCTVIVIAALQFGQGCADPSPPAIVIYADGDSHAQVRAFAEPIPYTGLRVEQTSDPIAEARDASGIAIAVIADMDCTECYRLERTGTSGLLVRGDAPLGIQYGLAHIFEELGFRFFHPWRTHVPDPPRLREPTESFDVDFEPEMATRGLHLHTLHPVESYFAFWEPGQANFDDAVRIVDWMIKNRGNYVQWVALDDIILYPDRAEAWRSHTRKLLDAIHERGVRAGLGIQLFGQSNLQQAFDLIDAEEGIPTPREEMEARYPIILDELPFDSISLSFGEFFGEDPQAFVDSVNLAYTILQEHAPGTRMTGTIHVGGGEDLRVDFQGENLIYYFLIKFANPAIVHFVHTVMYYNLFESADAAYDHADFAEHRAHLLERLEAGQPVAYHPETAYWVAFDISVPTYVPLYVRSRWLDLAEIRAAGQAAGAGPLQEHSIFTSGWEWGYWQNDYAALRTSYSLPSSWESVFRDMFAPLGDAGERMAAEIIAVTEAQHDYLMGKRLAAYMAGRDVYIDLGDKIDIHSQPDRPSFAEVVAMSDAERNAFVTDVLEELEAFRLEIDGSLTRVAELSAAGAEPWHAELVDGLAVDEARVRFIHAAYRTAVAYADSQTDDGWLGEAEAALAHGRAIVERRHANLHLPSPDRILYGITNATLYQWGYLKQADELCYWEREVAQLRRMVRGSDEPVPPCVF